MPIGFVALRSYQIWSFNSKRREMLPYWDWDWDWDCLEKRAASLFRKEGLACCGLAIMASELVVKYKWWGANSQIGIWREIVSQSNQKPYQNCSIPLGTRYAILYFGFFGHSSHDFGVPTFLLRTTNSQPVLSVMPCFRLRLFSGIRIEIPILWLV